MLYSQTMIPLHHQPSFNICGSSWAQSPKQWPVLPAGSQWRHGHSTVAISPPRQLDFSPQKENKAQSAPLHLLHLWTSHRLTGLTSWICRTCKSSSSSSCCKLLKEAMIMRFSGGPIHTEMAGKPSAMKDSSLQRSLAVAIHPWLVRVSINADSIVKDLKLKLAASFRYPGAKLSDLDPRA